MVDGIRDERGATIVEAALLLIAISLIAVVAMSVVGRSNRGLWQEVAAAATGAPLSPVVRVLGQTASDSAAEATSVEARRGSCAVLGSRGAWHDVIDGPWDTRWRPGKPDEMRPPRPAATP